MANISSKLNQTFKDPNIAATYGPYASVATAHAALADDGLNIVGMTVGIINSQDNTIVEYWYQGGTAQANLVRKEEEQVQADWMQDNTRAKDYIKRKPNIPTGFAYVDLVNESPITLSNKNVITLEGLPVDMRQAVVHIEEDDFHFITFARDFVDGHPSTVYVYLEEVEGTASFSSVDTWAELPNYLKAIWSTGASEQIQSDWNQSNSSAKDYIKNKPTIPAEQVNADWNAASGKAQILNKPAIPAAQIQSDWEQSDNTKKDFIKNKPTIPDVSNFVEKSNTAGLIKNDGTVDTTPKAAASDLTDEIARAQGVEATKANASDVYTRAQGTALEESIDDFKDDVLNDVQASVAAQQQVINTLNGNDVVHTDDHTQEASPDTTKIYREPEVGAANPTYYIDWMHDGTNWKFIGKYSFPGMDAAPTKDSLNLVNSGTVLTHGGALDISMLNADTSGSTPVPAKYRDLASALGTNGANVPVGQRAPGMSVKFIQETPAMWNVVKSSAGEIPSGAIQLVTDPAISNGQYTATQLTIEINTVNPIDWASQSLGTTTVLYFGYDAPYDIYTIQKVSNSDNKYIHYRLMAQNFTTDVTQWQGVDEKPTAGSHNLVESGGVDDDYVKISNLSVTPNTSYNGKIIGNDGIIGNGYANRRISNPINAQTCIVDISNNTSENAICFYDDNINLETGAGFISSIKLSNPFTLGKIVIPPVNAVYIVFVYTQESSEGYFGVRVWSSQKKRNIDLYESIKTNEQDIGEIEGNIDDINEHLYKIVPQSLYYLTWTKGQYTDTGNPNGTTTYATKESELLFVKKGESLSINDENYEFQICFYDNTPSHVFIRRDEKKSSYTFTDDAVIHVTVFRKNSTTAITDYIATGAKLIYSEIRTEASTCLSVYEQQNLRKECKQYGLDNLGIGYVNKVVNRLNIEDLTWKSGYITETGNINSLARGRVEIEKFEVKKGESIEIESTSAYSVGIVYYNQDNTKTRYGYEKSITFPKDGTIQLGVKTDNDSAMSDEQFVQALSLMTLNRTYGLPDSYLSILNAQNLSNKQKDIAKRNLGISTCFVSSDGNDSNDGTQEHPFATFQHAIDLGYKDIVGFPGVYKNQAISVTNKNGLKISCLRDNDVTDRPYFDSHTRIGRITFDNSTNAENVALDGTTNLYKFAINRGEDSNWYKVFIGQTMTPERVISSNQTSYNAILWEINRNDITACKKLVPVLSIAACQSQTGSFYYDGTHCYVNPNASDLTDIVFKYLDNEADYNIIALTNCRDIVLENINGYFGTDRIVEITRCVGDNIIDNCDFGFSAYHGGCGVNNSNFKIYDSNVFLTVTDGFNINYYGNVDLYNCSGRYCGDDGVSHHDGCTGVIDGGIWEGNYKAGVAPSYGSRINVYNVYCTNNAYGLYLVGDSSRKTNYRVLVNNCVFVNNSNKDILTMHYSGFISNTTYHSINMSTGSNITLVGNNIVE